MKNASLSASTPSKGDNFCPAKNLRGVFSQSSGRGVGGGGEERWALRVFSLGGVADLMYGGDSVILREEEEGRSLAEKGRLTDGGGGGGEGRFLQHLERVILLHFPRLPYRRYNEQHQISAGRSAAEKFFRSGSLQSVSSGRTAILTANVRKMEKLLTYM